MAEMSSGKSTGQRVRHETPSLVPVLSGDALENDLLNGSTLLPPFAMAGVPSSEPKPTASRSNTPTPHHALGSHRSSSDQVTPESEPGGGMHIGRVYFAHGFTTIMDTAIGVAMAGVGAWFTAAQASGPLWSGAGAAVTLGCAALVLHQFRSGNISWQKHDKPDS